MTTEQEQDQDVGMSICQRGRGVLGEKGDRQRGLTANRHSYWLCLFIFAIPPKWDGGFAVEVDVSEP